MATAPDSPRHLTIDVSTPGDEQHIDVVAPAWTRHFTTEPTAAEWAVVAGEDEGK